MKKRIFCLSMAMLMILTSAFGLVSCMTPTTPTPTPGPTTQTCPGHKDENHDGKCDNIQFNCTATVKVEHVDANHDGVCDVKKCGKKNLKVTHNDEDKNYICDDCKAVLEHTSIIPPKDAESTYPQAAKSLRSSAVFVSPEKHSKQITVSNLT